MTFHIILSLVVTNTLTFLVTYWLHQHGCDLEARLEDVELRFDNLDKYLKLKNIKHEELNNKIEEFITSNYDIVD